ncbi:MAG: hypothetical protein ABIR66_08750 [Saprospiraceae bacterium]
MLLETQLISSEHQKQTLSWSSLVYLFQSMGENQISEYESKPVSHKTGEMVQ